MVFSFSVSALSRSSLIFLQFQLPTKFTFTLQHFLPLPVSIIKLSRGFSPQLSPSYTKSNFPAMSEVDQMTRLERNAQLAENIISDIYSKLADIEQTKKKGNIETLQLMQLRKENELLRMEVAKWKELLLIRQIRNGANPVVGSASEIGKTVHFQQVATVSSCKSEATGLAKIHQSDKNKSKPAGSGAAIDKLTPASTTKLNASYSCKKVNVPNDNKNPQHKSPAKSVQNSNVTATATNQIQNQPSQPPTAAGSGDVDVSKLDFRVGLITKCDPHPDADSLYVEQIDLGEEKPRTIISGLVKHVPLQEMQNRLVVVLANLKPAKMRGILSEGMVMCASTPEKVEILRPPAGSAPGDLVEIEGYPRNPDSVLNPKKKIFETVQPDLKTNDNKEATYKGKLWTIPGKGTIVASTLVNTMIK